MITKFEDGIMETAGLFAEVVIAITGFGDHHVRLRMDSIRFCADIGPTVHRRVWSRKADSTAGISRDKAVFKLTKNPGYGRETGAVAGSQLLNVKLLQRGDGFLNPLFGSIHQVRSANYRVDAVDTSRLAGVIQRIDQTTVSTPGYHYQPLGQGNKDSLIIQHRVVDEACPLFEEEMAFSRAQMFEVGHSRDLPAGCDIPGDLHRLGGEMKDSPVALQFFALEWHSQKSIFSFIPAMSVFGSPDIGMSDNFDLFPSDQAEDIPETSGVVEVAVAQDNRIDFS
jgi:hypothetical protein